MPLIEVHGSVVRIEPCLLHIFVLQQHSVVFVFEIISLPLGIAARARVYDCHSFHVHPEARRLAKTGTQ